MQLQMKKVDSRPGWLTNAHLSNKVTILLVFAAVFTCAQSLAQVNFYHQLADAAVELTSQKVTYDPAYVRIGYPNGDVPADKGVCTDVLIRAYRKLGIDLQKEVHEDMRDHFNLYPKNWGLTRPDKNIDHRRVPNLMVFFNRHGEVKSITKKCGRIPSRRYCLLGPRRRFNTYRHGCKPEVA